VKSFLHSAAAVIAGMFTNMILTFVVTAAVVFGLPSLGGWVTSRLAPSPKMRTTFVYAMVLLALGTVYYVEAGGGVQPDWYLLGLVVMGVPAALIGGKLGALGGD